MNFANFRLLILIPLCFIAIANLKGADKIGSLYIGNALVQYKLANENNVKMPIVMVHGHNLSSYIYATTPDHRKGWLDLFVEDGYDVYMINDPKFDFARSGFSVAPFDSVPDEGQPALDPNSTLPWQSDIWRRWGFGSSYGNPYENARFPADSFENFEANYPYVSNSDITFTQALSMLLDSINKPVILMGHSAGGPVVLDAAKARANQVKAIIYIEPTGPPTASDFPALAGLSMFGVYGDYIDSRRQGNRKLATEQAAELFSANGGIGDVVSLPDDSLVYGNSHLMMQDDNNDYIQQIIVEWIESVFMTTRLSNKNMPDKACRIYPNPLINNRSLNIVVNGDIQDFEIKIYDAARRIMHTSHIVHQGANTIRLNIPEALNDGIYVVEISNNDKLYYKKLIVR